MSDALTSSDPLSPILLAGPTAVGKSDIALHLAEAIGGEIVSVDSMQVYRGMDVGTAKPSATDRQRVPHHLLDVLEVSQRFDAAQFVKLARLAVTEIQARQRRPILCGGTGLYFKAFLEGLGPAPAADPKLRAELAALPLEVLAAELAKKDPETHRRIDLRNPRRLIRAVEVLRLTGRPFSAQRAAWQGPQTQMHFFGLTREAPELSQRIRARVDQMFRRGLVGETQALLKRGLAENPIAMQALGYRQVVEYLMGERPLEATIELVKLRTRQFAKKQMTWFRKQVGVNWTTLSNAETAQSVAESLARQLIRRD